MILFTCFTMDTELPALALMFFNTSLMMEATLEDEALKK